MKKTKTNTLLIGIGNSGRADDGLGWAFLDQIIGSIPSHWQCEYRYQLQIEDAELLSNFERVLFIDSDHRNHPEGFIFETVKAQPKNGFTSHQLAPETVLYLCEEIYKAHPKSFIIGISGEDFSLKQGLNTKAVNNLEKAFQYFKTKAFQKIWTDNQRGLIHL